MNTKPTTHIRKLTQDVAIPNKLADKRQTRSWLAHGVIPAGTEIRATVRPSDSVGHLVVEIAVDPGTTLAGAYVADGLSIYTYVSAQWDSFPSAASDNEHVMFGAKLLLSSTKMTGTLRTEVLEAFPNDDIESRTNGDRIASIVLQNLWESGMITKQMLMVAAAHNRARIEAEEKLADVPTQAG